MSRDYPVKNMTKVEFLKKLKSGVFSPVKYYSHPEDGSHGMNLGKDYAWLDTMDGKFVLMFYGKQSDDKIIDVLVKKGVKIQDGDEPVRLTSGFSRMKKARAKFMDVF